MDKVLTGKPNTTNAKALQAEIKQMFVEMEQTDERIQGRRERIDRLQVETRAILAELRVK